MAMRIVGRERRKLRMKVVNLEPHRQRHVPPMEVRRAEHEMSPKGFVRFAR